MRVRPVVVCAVVILVSACTRQVDGEAVHPMAARPAGVVDVDELLLGPQQIRAITDSDALTGVSGRSGKDPVDDAESAAAVPQACRFLFSDSATFGPDREDFTTTTYRIPPPNAATISEAAAAYRDVAEAAAAFTALRTTAIGCADSPFGFLVGAWTADAHSMRMRAGQCGRDYSRKFSVLVEVTFCGFPDPATEIVMSNILSRILPRR